MEGMEAPRQEAPNPVIAENTPMMELRGISKHFGGVTALDRANLKLFPREIVVRTIKMRRPQRQTSARITWLTLDIFLKIRHRISGVAPLYGYRTQRVVVISVLRIETHGFFERFPRLHRQIHSL